VIALSNLDAARALRDRGALFFLNHSGGKDSQAQTLLVRHTLGVPDSQIVVIHAHLGRVEWGGVIEHIRATTPGLPLQVAHPLDRDGNRKDLLDSVRARDVALRARRAETGKRASPWPSPGQRWCTSDFKRGPLQREMRRIMRERGAALAVSCMGLRADESDHRECGLDKGAYKETGVATTMRRNEDMSKAGREVYDWLPIHTLTTPEVFQVIAEHGQTPHPAYAAGMTRLSCSFCIMARKSDLQTAARLRPDLYAEYVRIERETGYTMQSKPLTEITGVDPDDDEEEAS
jgi:DNA sulfur modification protein DndC